ncbi:hypothetical protein [Leptolyngbya ohadii]|uniref:hypothetical protein n=1 Tax=Leptolyngbya ohadii TaxID=1962290 RepID=UPI000B598831|nr:hypothetical protein [Leptolyngbya ohadii]
MAYLPQRSQSPRTSLLSTLSEYWHWWRETCDRSVAYYYTQRIESDPEGEAQQYWNCIKNPRSGVDIYQITDAMLSRLMQQLSEQGISRFAVDRFILELRRLTRTVRIP